jgi:hypothetical protein
MKTIRENGIVTVHKSTSQHKHDEGIVARPTGLEPHVIINDQK